MRTALFTGLLLIAYSINPVYMTDTIEKSASTVILINIAMILSLLGDMKELLKSNK